jgi:hypothetical protein
VIAPSSRHAVPVLAVAALAAIPIGWHALAAPTADRCRDPDALIASQSIGEGRVTGRRTAPEAPDVLWIDGEMVPPPDVVSMQFRVSRSFAPSNFYGSSEVQSFDNSFSFDRAGDLMPVDADGVELPVHWLEDPLRMQFRLRAHFYVFDGHPVESPFSAGVAVAGRQMVRGTLPVTLFVFAVKGRPRVSDQMRSAARDWLRAAWRRYQEVCTQ